MTPIPQRRRCAPEVWVRCGEPTLPIWNDGGRRTSSRRGSAHRQWSVGSGPTAILPTATQRWLSGDVMTLGPAGVALWQRDGWTIGSLVTQNWRVAGPGDYNATYFQPFLSHTFKTATTLSVDSESSYDWIDEQWTISFKGGVSQVFNLGKIPVQIALELQYYGDSPVPGQQWGMRINITPMFPELVYSSSWSSNSLGVEL